MIEPREPGEEKNYGWKAKLVKDFILANPGATIREVSKATRASERTVSNVRQDLLRAGRIAPATVGRPPSEVPDSILLDEEAIRRDIDNKIASGGVKVLTRDERRQRLTLFADHPKVPHAARIAALKELEATEPPEEARELGPGKPLTTEERVTRAALILEALTDIDGQGSVMDALVRGLGSAYKGFIGAIVKGEKDAAEAEVQNPASDASPDAV